MRLSERAEAMISHFIFFNQFHLLTNEKNYSEPSDAQRPYMLTLLTLTNLLISFIQLSLSYQYLAV